MSTFLQLVNQLKNELGVEGSDLSTVAGQTGMYAKLIIWIAKANDEVISKHVDWNFRWKEHTENLVLDATGVAAPADLGGWDMESFCLDYGTSSYNQLDFKSYKKWRAEIGNAGAQSGTPSYVAVQPDGALVFDAKLDAAHAFRAEYFYTPNTLSANDDTSIIPSLFHSMLVERAKIWYAEEEGIPNLIRTASTAYEAYLSNLEHQYLPGQDGDRAAPASSHNEVHVV